MEQCDLGCQVCLNKSSKVRDIKSHLRTLAHQEKIKEVFHNGVYRSSGFFPYIVVFNPQAKRDLNHPIIGLSCMTLCFSRETQTSFYLCHVCEDKRPPEKILSHLSSHDHYSNYFNYTDPNVLRFSWMPSMDMKVILRPELRKEVKERGSGTLQLLDLPGHLMKKLDTSTYSEVMHTFSENDKLLKLFEATKPKRTTIQTYQKDSTRKHPLLGMEHLVECVCVVQTQKTYYLCTLCKITLDDNMIIKHVLSFDHIFCYFKVCHPSTLPAKECYKNYTKTFVSMMLDFAKQAEEIHGTADTNMKQVSLEPAEFTSVNFKSYIEALTKLESITKGKGGISLITSIKPGNQLEFHGMSTVSIVSKQPCKLCCQDCKIIFETVSQYLKHLSDRTHKQILETFLSKAEKAEGSYTGWKPNLGLYTYLRENTQQPVIGLSLVVACVCTQFQAETVYVCFACQEIVSELCIPQHIKSQKHLINTLLYQNPWRLPFAWEKQLDVKLLRLLAGQEEEERRQDHMILKVLDVPYQTFQSLIPPRSSGVTDGLDLQPSLLTHLMYEVPQCETHKLKGNERFPLLGKQFMVSHDVFIDVFQSRKVGFLCLLCERRLLYGECYAHVFSREHVAKFLDLFHPGSQNASTDAETLLDLAKQAARCHSISNSQVIKLDKPIWEPCPYHKVISILTAVKKRNGAGALKPPIMPLEKLVPRNTLKGADKANVGDNSQKNSGVTEGSENTTSQKSTDNSNIPKLSVEIGSGIINEGCIKREEGAEKGDPTPTTTGRESERRELFSRTSPDEVMSAGYTGQLIKEEQNIEEPTQSLQSVKISENCQKTDNGDGAETLKDVSKSSKAVLTQMKYMCKENERKRPSSMSEESQGDTCCDEHVGRGMENKRQRLTLKDDASCELQKKGESGKPCHKTAKDEVSSTKTHQQAAQLWQYLKRDRESREPVVGLGGLIECHCDQHHPIYLCECCLLLIPEKDIVSHIIGFDHQKMYLVDFLNIPCPSGKGQEEMRSQAAWFEQQIGYGNAQVVEVDEEVYNTISKQPFDSAIKIVTELQAQQSRGLPSAKVLPGGQPVRASVIVHAQHEVCSVKDSIQVVENASSVTVVPMEVVGASQTVATSYSTVATPTKSMTAMSTCTAKPSSSTAATTKSIPTAAKQTATTKSTQTDPKRTDTAKSTPTDPKRTDTTKSTPTYPKRTATTKSTPTDPKLTATTKSTPTDPKLTATTKLIPTDPKLTATTKSIPTDPRLTATTILTPTDPRLTATTILTPTDPRLTATTILTPTDPRLTATTIPTPTDFRLTAITSSSTIDTTKSREIVPHIHKSDAPDAPHLTMSEHRNPPTESPDTTMTKTKANAPKVGVNQLIIVGCEQRRQVYCQLCSVKLAQSNHLYTANHQYNYVKMAYPGWTAKLSESGNKLDKIVALLAEVEKDIGSRAQILEVNNDVYDEIRNLTKDKALERLKAMLRERDLQGSSTTDNYEAQRIAFASPYEVSDDELYMSQDDPPGLPNNQPEQENKHELQRLLKMISNKQEEADQSDRAESCTDVDRLAHFKITPTTQSLAQEKPCGCAVPLTTDSEPACQETAVNRELVERSDPGIQGTKRSSPVKSHSPGTPSSAATVNTEQKQLKSSLKADDVLKRCSPGPGHQSASSSIQIGVRTHGGSHLSTFLSVRGLDTQPIVGLGFVWECRGTPSLDSFYLCESCREMLFIHDICQHMVSPEHQLKYLIRQYPQYMPFEMDLEEMKREILDNIAIRISEWERSCNMDAQGILLKQELYEHVRRSPFSEAMKIVQTIKEHQQLRVPFVSLISTEQRDKQPKNQQSGKESPPMEAPEIDQRSDNGAREKTEKHHLEEETVMARGLDGVKCRTALSPVDETHVSLRAHSGAFPFPGAGTQLSPKVTCRSLRPPVSQHVKPIADVQEKQTEVLSQSQSSSPKRVQTPSVSSRDKFLPAREKSADTPVETAMIKSCTNNHQLEDPLPVKGTQSSLQQRQHSLESESTSVTTTATSSPLSQELLPESQYIYAVHSPKTVQTPSVSPRDECLPARKRSADTPVEILVRSCTSNTQLEDPLPAKYIGISQLQQCQSSFKAASESISGPRDTGPESDNQDASITDLPQYAELIALVKAMKSDLNVSPSGSVPDNAETTTCSLSNSSENCVGTKLDSNCLQTTCKMAKPQGRWDLKYPLIKATVQNNPPAASADSLSSQSSSIAGDLLFRAPEDKTASATPPPDSVNAQSSFGDVATDHNTGQISEPQSITQTDTGGASQLHIPVITSRAHLNKRQLDGCNGQGHTMVNTGRQVTHSFSTVEVGNPSNTLATPGTYSQYSQMSFVTQEPSGHLSSQAVGNYAVPYNPSVYAGNFYQHQGNTANGFYQSQIYPAQGVAWFNWQSVGQSSTLPNCPTAAPVPPGWTTAATFAGDGTVTKDAGHSGTVSFTAPANNSQSPVPQNGYVPMQYSNATVAQNTSQFYIGPQFYQYPVAYSEVQASANSSLAPGTGVFTAPFAAYTMPPTSH